MKLRNLLITAFIILTALVIRLGFFNNLTASANSNINDNLTPLILSQNNNYEDLSNSTTFAIFNNNYYYNKNGTLRMFDTTKKSSNKITLNNNEILTIDIQNTDSHIFLVNSDMTVVALNINNQPVPTINNQQIKATQLKVIKVNMTTYLLTYHNDTLSLYKLNDNLIVEEVQTQEISGIQSIYLNENEIYALTYNAKIEMILKYPIEDFENRTPDIVFNQITQTLNTKKIAFANIYDKTYLIAKNILPENKTSIGIYNTKEVISKTNDLVLEIKTKENTNNNSIYEINELKNIADFKVANNSIIIFDDLQKSIKAFSLTTTSDDKLKVNSVKTLLASSSYEKERFNNPKHILNLNSNEIIVSDTNNKRLQVISNLQTKEIYDEAINYPIKTLKDINNNLIILNKNIQNSYDLIIYKNQTASYLLQNTLVIDITNDSLNNIYVLTSDGILIFNNYELINQISNLSISTNTKISLNKGNLVLLDNNFITSYDKDFNLINRHSLTNLRLSNDFSLTNDFYDNLFILSDNNIYKINNNDLSVIENVININKSDDFINLSLNQETGEFVLFNNNLQQIFKLKDDTLSNGLNDYEHKCDFDNLSLNSEKAKLGFLNSTTYIYNYPKFTGNYNIVLEDKVVLILDNSEDFVFVAYEHDYKLYTGYILKDSYELVNYQNYDNNSPLLTTIYSTKTYKIPTILKNNSDNLLVSVLPINTYITPIFNKVKGLDNKYYYPIILNSNILYISEHDVILESDELIKPILQTNAKLFNESGQITVYGDIELTLSNEILNNGHQIKIVKKLSNNITLIKYLDSYNNEKTGYINTNDISVFKLSTIQITAIIISCLGLIFLTVTIVLFVRYTKNSKE